MNPEIQISEFEKVVENLSKIQQCKDVEIFRDTIIQYPYFQTAQLFYILLKYQIESIFSEQELTQAAIYSGSRAKLYNYLSGEIGIRTEKDQDNQGEKQQDAISVSPSKPKASKDQISSIIDKFINEKPSIQKPASEFFSPSGMAAKSLEEDNDIVTENLAKIYVRNKLYSKAIRVYEKLMLHYPEKSNYFATLIESLKDKINE
jgi:hypothetical protein